MMNQFQTPNQGKRQIIILLIFSLGFMALLLLLFFIFAIYFDIDIIGVGK